MLPRFSLVEILASLGGLVFMGLLLGSLVFTTLSNFYMENDLISKLYTGHAPSPAKVMAHDDEEQPQPTKL
mgnify:CR=1 FL=1